jgi:hypothetical protein
MDDNVTSNNYVLMLPGYVNPSATLYTVQDVGKRKVAFQANMSTGLKLLPCNTIITKGTNDKNKSKLDLSNNIFLQYYFGFGAGISFRKYMDFNIQYNRLYHDISDETREKFRAEYLNTSFHGSYVDFSLRVHLLTIPINKNSISLFSEFEWRGLGRSYQKNKSVALGFGLLFTPVKRTETKKEEVRKLESQAQDLK